MTQAASLVSLLEHLGNIRRAAKPSVTAGKALEYVTHPATQTLAGAGLGALAGKVQNDAWDTEVPGGWSPVTKDLTIGGTALAGALLGNPRTRRQIMQGEKTLSKDVFTGPKGLKTTVTTTTPNSRFLYPVVAIPSALTIPGTLAHLREGSNSLVKEFQNVDPAELVKTQITPQVEQTVSTWLGQMTPAAKDTLKDLGLAAGGSVAGFLGGGSLGGLMGNWLAPDDEKADYNTRSRREKTRGLVKTIGRVLGSYGSALAAPLLYAKLMNRGN